MLFENMTDIHSSRNEGSREMRKRMKREAFIPLAVLYGKTPGTTLCLGQKRGFQALQTKHSQNRIVRFRMTTPPTDNSLSPRAQHPDEAIPSGAMNEESQVEAECPYCHNVKIVSCPACEGRGYHGRTITCYYCNGLKEVECPLCIDDIYKLSYVKRTDTTFKESEGDTQ